MPMRRVAELLEKQLTYVHDFARNLFADLTDEEYFWEPVPGCWSVRQNDGTNPPELPGLLGVPEGGPRPNTRPWYCEHGWVWKGPRDAGWVDTGGDSPVTTIAWLMTHMSHCQIVYHQDIFNSGTRRFDDLVPTSAAEAIAMYEEGASLLIESLQELDDEQLLRAPANPQPPEIRQSPFGLNGEPLWELFVAPISIHTMHHAAEVGRMRDLHRRLA
jgi:hypothetical protein